MHDDFEALLSGEPGRPISADELTDLAVSRGRVLIQAPAGAGKSSFLRAFSEGVPERLKVDYVDLSRLEAHERNWVTPEDAEHWLWTRVNEAQGPRILCADSLDEVPADQGQNFLDAVENVTNQVPACSVIVADRLGRRRLRTHRWALASLSVLPQSVVSESTGTDAVPRWLLLPYFVDSWRSYGAGANPAEMISHRVNSVLDTDESQRVASAALEVWESLGQSVMERGWLLERLDVDLVRRMSENGLVRDDGAGRWIFEHGLVHGYFAALAVAMDRSLWDKRTFEALTFKGANFEALGMLLTMVDDSRVDELVRCVDGWNFYAAAYLLAEDFDADERTSPWLRAALLLLLGRRRFSVVPSTRMQVEDSLRLHRGDLAAAVLRASDERELVSIAAALPIEHSWWSRWLSVYARLPGETASGEDISALVDDDGVVAWTAANVLLHAVTTEDTRERLAEIANDAADEGARWRAVHVLGGADDPRSLAVLVARFRSDPSPWVRNGALRSGILVASRLDRPEDRANFFLGLADMSGELLSNPKWLREIERSTQLDTPPADWPAAVGILLEVLWAASNTVDEQDRWRRLSASLRTAWAGSSKLGSLR